MSSATLAGGAALAGEVKRTPIPGEWIIKTRSGEFEKKKLSDKEVRSLRDQKSVEWIEPNYLYTGDPKETDPMVGDQDHHRVMRNFEAWQVARNTASGNSAKILIAVTDNGVDVDHPDLKDAIAYNTKDVPGNGLDDDRNGYVDDYDGWNSVDLNGNPRPTSAVDDHGTHVAGIIAATPDNGVGVAGSARGVGIVPIKFYGNGIWTSKMVLDGYRYAIARKVKIISTSYNVDAFVGDRVFEDALAQVYRAGILHMNSAGNNKSENPRRTNFEELVLVCSTVANGTQDDRVSTFSNYGDLVHLCSPGGGTSGDAGDLSVGILSTLPNNQYGRMSGTSMATPNAAAVAGLIWAQNPNWSRAQVLAQLLGTANPIDALNPNFVGKTGTGRTDSLAAITGQARVSGFLGVREVSGGIAPAGTSQLSLLVSGVLDPTQSTRLDSYSLTSAGKDQKLGTSDDVRVAVKLVTTPKEASRLIRLQRSNGQALPRGLYQISSSPSLRDPFGVPAQKFSQLFSVL